jgi:hypothetical protein
MELSLKLIITVNSWPVDKRLDPVLHIQLCIKGIKFIAVLARRLLVSFRLFHEIERMQCEVLTYNSSYSNGHELINRLQNHSADQVLQLQT